MQSLQRAAFQLAQLQRAVLGWVQALGLQCLLSSLPCMQCWTLYFCIRSLDAGIETLDSQNAVMDQAA